MLFLGLMRTNPNVTIFRPIEALDAVFERQSNPVELPGSCNPDRANTTYECRIKSLPVFTSNVYKVLRQLPNLNEKGQDLSCENFTMQLCFVLDYTGSMS